MPRRPATLLTLIAAVTVLPVTATAVSRDLPDAQQEWQRVVDDTGTIAVTVPPGWVVETAPRTTLDTALPEVGAYIDPPDVGIRLSASVLVEDLERQICGRWYVDECTAHEVAGLRGVSWYAQECCAGPSRWITFVANPTAGQRITIELDVLAMEPDEPDPALLDRVASSVEILAEPFPADWVVSATELAPPIPGLWPYGDFHDVPQLGTEPVRGSGCGADGSIGDVIPDGLWAGNLAYVPDDDHWEVNLVCVYAGDAAQEVLATGIANVIDDADPDYVIVDNNPRTRAMPNRAQMIETSFADVRTEEQCLGGGLGEVAGERDHVVFDPGQFEERFSTSHQAWIRIHEGAVTWIRFGCDSELWPGPGG